MKHAMKKWLALLLSAAMVLSLVACGGNNADSGDKNSNNSNNSSNADTNQSDAQQEEENYDGKLVSDGFMEVEYSTLFTIEQFKGGYRMITAGLEGSKDQYLVVPEGMSVPAELDDGVIVLQKPIRNVRSSSSAMVSLADAIDALDSFKFVHTENWYIDGVVERMEQGSIVYAGTAAEPDYELITDGQAELNIMTGGHDDSEVVEKYTELGIPTFGEESSLEGTPLGRVEWVKILGVLFDKEEEADTWFAAQKDLVASVTTDEPLGKTVAMGYVSGDKSYARNGGDYFAQMIGMAGGTYVCADMNPDKTGNSNMTFEEWFNLFGDADFFFYINWGEKFYSIEDMIAYNPLFAEFKAVQSGNVYISSPDFAQAVAGIASIIVDMHTILASEDPTQVTTDHLIRIPEKAA